MKNLFRLYQTVLQKSDAIEALDCVFSVDLRIAGSIGSLFLLLFHEFEDHPVRVTQGNHPRTKTGTLCKGDSFRLESLHPEIKGTNRNGKGRCYHLAGTDAPLINVGPGKEGKDS